MIEKMKENKIDEILTTAEAAAFLKIPTGSLRNIVWRGQIKPLKCGRHYRFTKKCLLDFLKRETFNGD